MFNEHVQEHFILAHSSLNRFPLFWNTSVNGIHRITLVYIYIYTSVDLSINIDRVLKSCHQWMVLGVVLCSMFVIYFVKYFVKHFVNHFAWS